MQQSCSVCHELAVPAQRQQSDAALGAGMSVPLMTSFCPVSRRKARQSTIRSDSPYYVMK